MLALVGASGGAKIKSSWSRLEGTERGSPCPVGGRTAEGISEARMRIVDEFLSTFLVDSVYMSFS